MHTKRPWGAWAAIVVVAVLLVGALTAVSWDISVLRDSAQRSMAFGRMGAWLLAFASPELDHAFLQHCWALTLQTLSAALLATFLAIIAALVLAMGSSKAVSVGHDKQGVLGRWASRFTCSLSRLIQDVLRGVPDFVWAVILVALIGLGPLTGALALALSMTGILAKVYSELWDSVAPKRYEQVRILGSGRLGILAYGIMPLAARSVQSFTLVQKTMSYCGGKSGATTLRWASWPLRLGGHCGSWVGETTPHQANNRAIFSPPPRNFFLAKRGNI